MKRFICWLICHKTRKLTEEETRKYFKILLGGGRCVVGICERCGEERVV